MSEQRLHLRVNGQAYELTIPADRFLLDVLRDDLELLGTKEACDEGECGACTVLVDGRAVDSCIFLALQADGADVRTVEGLAVAGQLDPLQRAFIDEGAVQCGYCTAGMLMSAKALLDENPDPDESQIRAALEGNLCRCTGYDAIIRAVKAASGGRS